MNKLYEEITELPNELDDEYDYYEIDEVEGRVALCTLGSINWGSFRNPEDMRRACRILHRSLNNILDYQDFLSIQSKLSNDEIRPLGIGITNLAYWHAKRGFKYGDNDALAEVKSWMEHQMFYLTEMSVELAKERGACLGSSKTRYGQGQFPWENRANGVNELADFTPELDWEPLRAEMIQHGVRNATNGAVAPVESSSVVINSTNGIEMPMSLISVKESKAGSLTQVVPEYHKLKDKYQLMWKQTDCEPYLKTAAVIAVYIDQSISTNTFYNPANYPDRKVPTTLIAKNQMRKGLVVQKYGGSSVANVERIQKVAERVVKYHKNGYSLVVVVSALGDTTDELIALADKINSNPPEREMDMLLSTGEQISVALLAMAIHKLGKQAISFTGSQVGIITDTSHTKARIIKITADKIKEALKKGKIVIVAGFQGVTLNQDITTLGRGGSDLTAVALAKELQADSCEIYTDVEGIYTTDPRIEPNAKKINEITYDEMLEMASLGAQVMQARSIEVAKKFNVPLHVRSSFSDKNGTMIIKEVKKMEEVVVSGITLNKNNAKITLCQVKDKPGVAVKLFKDLAMAGVSVDMIVQNVSHTRQTDISFTVAKTDCAKAGKITKMVAKKIGAGEVLLDEDIARVSIVGVGMKSHHGVAAKMFKVMADNKINIEMISTSDISISCIIKKKNAEVAVKKLHKEFGLN